MKNIFITGGSGFLGFAIIRYLRHIEKGNNIYVLAREKSKTRHLNPYNVELVYGDLCQPEDYKEELRVCDTVFHCAGQIGFDSRNREIFMRTNYEGTMRIAETTNPAILEHFVYTSTKGTKSSKVNQPNDEDTTFDLADILDPYLESKIKAEEYIKSKIEKGFPASIILPTGLIGWGDVKPTPMGKLVKDFLDQRIPFCPPGGMDLVDVDDVAKAHVETVRQGKIGESFIVSGRFVTFQELFQILAQTTRLKAPRFKLPISLFYTMVFLKEKYDSILGKPPTITLKKARAATSFMESSSEKLIRELGFRPRKVEEAIEKAVKFFQGDDLEG